VPDEPGKSQRIEIGKDRLFSLLRSYTELYELNHQGNRSYIWLHC